MLVHKVTYGSMVNGPGLRNVLHLQGCTLACAGCFNPQTWSLKSGAQRTTTELVDDMLKGPLDGITISGGEPFQQEEELVDFLVKLRARDEEWVKPVVPAVIIFSGYTREELEALPRWPEVTSLVDVIVSGRFVLERRVEIPNDLRGSSNQEIIFLNDAYTHSDLLQHNNVEVIIDNDGVLLTGFPSSRLIDNLRNNLRGN